MTPLPLNDKQLRVLRYVKKRATPPTTSEVALQTMMSKNGAHLILSALVRKGYLESFLKKDPNRPKIVAERRYSFLTDTPEPQGELFQRKETILYSKKFAKTRVTMPEPFFSDPFNMTGVRDANKDNKRKHKRARNVQTPVASS